MFQSPGPILFKLGSFTIRWYGVMIAMGFLLAISAASRLAKRWHLNSERVINLAFVIFIGGIIGARLYFVMLTWSYFSQHLSETFATWNGGLSIHGGIIGGMLSGGFYCYRAKLPFLKCADLFASVIPLAQSVGRWGNFFNSEAFGKPVSDSFLLKLYIPMADRPDVYKNSNFFHPTFLYESIWDLGLFFFLYYFAADQLKRYPGLVFCVYLAGYSIGRLLVEPLRIDSIMLYGFPVPIAASALTLVAAAVGVAFIMMKYKSETSRNRQ